ncbi:polyprenol phosphomannose-dependent alpha 1,6 mannosyltransferase MptB [Trujillonella endophytica]|uniref:Alpha-1,6-mannosyltransferase n=1 Tax=Trujillonella endophytica TaxID=673521 RepID=A0A1H8RTY3_9ACTN|nr:polyprenol phosphomannose-dependent alpha 1,6 mannosyltransferase MptB [Trujillella endophytica]SEO69805.1 alpha-1,6-mannosyltransferase [Trujillella endophytica]
MTSDVRRLDRVLSRLHAVGSATVDPGRRKRAVLAAAVAGTLATTYLALAGTSVGRNVAAEDLWFFQVEAITRTALGARPALVLCGLALVLLGAAWLLLGWAVRHGAGTRTVVSLGALWSAPLAIGIPLFSPDAYIYTAVASSIQHGVDPFLDGPEAAGDVRGIRGGEQIWLENPSPYSPPFVRLLDLLAKVFHEDVRSVVVALRVLTVLAWIGLAVLAARIARLQGFDPTRTLWLVVANPLFLLHGVSGAHNDALMLVLLLAGVWLAMLRRPYLAVVLCAVGAGVKVIALAAVAVIAIDAAWRMPTLRERLRVLVSIGGTGLAVFVVAVTACGYGWTFLGNLDVPGLANEPLSPPTALANLISHSDPPLDAVRAVALAAGALICLWLLTRVPEWGLVRPTAWILVTIVLTGSVVWPWYFMWPVLLLALTGIRVDRWLAIGASLGSVYLALPGGEGTLGYLSRPLADALVVGGLAGAGAVALWVRRRRPAVGAVTPVPSHAGGAALPGT